MKIAGLAADESAPGRTGRGELFVCDRFYLALFESKQRLLANAFGVVGILDFGFDKEKGSSVSRARDRRGKVRSADVA
jgi:hypothetical protein